MVINMNETSGDGGGVAKLMESMLNQVLSAQADEAAGAGRYERSEGRTSYRSGTRVRTLYTRVGTLTLQVPQLRDGSFCPEIFKRYQRSEQAFVLAMMEMVVQGVSTRKVAAITEELCAVEISKSTVSRLCEGLDVRLKAFNERRLDGHKFPFVLVDAMYIKARGEDRVQSKAVLIASGVSMPPGAMDRLRWRKAWSCGSSRLAIPSIPTICLTSNTG